MRIITQKRLREYAQAHTDAKSSLERWEEVAIAASWRTPVELKQTFSTVDPVKVTSGNTVYVFNIGGNTPHRLIAAIHFNTQLVFVLRILTHAEYDKDAWKDEL